MTDEEMAAFVGRYYARAVRREPDAEQMAFFRKTVQSGLRPARLLAARPGRGTADLARDESRRLSRQTGKPQPVTGWGLRTINFIALP